MQPIDLKSQYCWFKADVDRRATPVEVIKRLFTFTAAAVVIALLAARPAFEDVEADIGSIAVGGRHHVSDAALMPVRLYRRCADMGLVSAVVRKHDLRSIIVSM